jgi:uncharacterized membrane protein YphA (DoxX/SURF4 family)
MNNLTRLLLVVLRLSIGWFFVAEGLEKIHPHPTTNYKEWTSAGYLRQSSGPLAPLFRWQAGGDADEIALDRLTVTDGHVSPGLRGDWEQYLERFADHYKLSPEQREEAKKKLDEALDDAAKWLTNTTSRKELDKNAAFPTASFAPRKSPAERIADYRAKVEEYRQAENQANQAFGNDVYKARLVVMKADAAKMRTDLLGDLEAVLRKGSDGPKGPDNRKGLESILTDEQKQMGPVPAPPAPAVVRWTDRIVSYGLLIAGAGLMLGLFTRLSCVSGALFLITLSLVAPPVPWIPEALRTKTYVPYINENIIMALALLALATTRSGLWFGLDGLVQFITPWGRRAAARRARAEAEAEAAVA